jgi:hypothetical protein
MITGDEDARRVGRGLLKLHAAATEAQFDFRDSVHVGKFGWGAASMLDVEPDEHHLRDAMRMGKWYLESQLEDGRWNPTAFLVPDPKEPDALWKTAEHILLISEVISAFSSFPRRAGHGHAGAPHGESGIEERAK